MGRSLAPRQRDHRVTLQVNQGFCVSAAQHTTPCCATVGEDRDTAAVRVLKSNVLQVFRPALGVEVSSAAPHESGIVRKGPILAAVGDRLALRIDGYYTATRKWTDVRLAMFIQRQVPPGNGAAPVSQNAGKGRAPLRPVGGIVGIGVVRPALS